MSAPKVRLSNIDRGISVFTAVNSYQSRKLNEQILNQQYKNNNHLSALRSQMSEANAINKQILANQLKAEEHKEAQKYYKALSFNLFETIDLFSKIDDTMVLNYVMTNFYDKIKSNIIEANDQLDEIVDKSYNKQSLDKLNAIKSKSDETMASFKSNVLSKVDNLIADFKTQELKISSLNKPELKEEIINRQRTNGFRTFGIIVLGLITAILLLIAVVGLTTGGGIGIMIIFLIITTPFGIPFIHLLQKEIKWRKDYDDFVNNKKLKHLEFEKSKLELEKNYQETLERAKEELSNHPLYNAMSEINDSHPSFDKYLSDITGLETIFAKKWGLSSETTKNIKDQENDAFDKKIIEYCLVGKKAEAVSYCMTTKGWAKNKATSYVNKLSYKNNIPVKAEGACFIATACYDDYNAPEVLLLRQFRDDKLLTTFSGKLFVSFYYSVSPFFATIISKSDRLKHSVRHYLLTPIVSHLQRHNAN